MARPPKKGECNACQSYKLIRHTTTVRLKRGCINSSNSPVDCGIGYWLAPVLLVLLRLDSSAFVLVAEPSLVPVSSAYSCWSVVVSLSVSSPVKTSTEN